MSGYYPPGVTGAEPQISGVEPCPCGDECEVVAVDCCDGPAYECETDVDRGHDETIRTHRVGTGCHTEPWDFGDEVERDAEVDFEAWLAGITEDEMGPPAEGPEGL